MPLAPALRGQLIRAQADVQMVGERGDTERIHSILLMTLSPYFQIVLADEAEQKTVRIDGADGEVLKLIKDYAYEGKTTGLTVENVHRVIQVADMYNIVGLLHECQLYVENQTRTDTARGETRRQTKP